MIEVYGHNRGIDSIFWVVNFDGAFWTILFWFDTSGARGYPTGIFSRTKTPDIRHELQSHTWTRVA